LVALGPVGADCARVVAMPIKAIAISAGRSVEIVRGMT
jgi:hypothetical protein